MNRREFLGIGLRAAAAPYILPAAVLGREGMPAPSDRITIGCIGVGWQGTSNMEEFLEQKDCRVVAVCDVDKKHLANAQALVNRAYGNRDCRAYHDFRELLAQPDIDAVMLALPDHWHALIAVAAAKAGKDIYGEKPLSHNLKEGRAIVEAVEENGRIWQTGSWQRSEANFRFACELVRNGRIGRVHTVEVGLPGGHTDFAGTFGRQKLEPPPPELDYEFWLGPAPYAPYAVERVHKNWRWHLDYGGGQLMDWVGHHNDIAHWGLDLDRSAPIEVEGVGEYPKDGFRNTATRYRIVCKYAEGVETILAGGYPEIAFGTKWIGDLGWVYVSRGGVIKTQPASLLREQFGPEEVHLYRSPGHFRNFLDCVKSRQETLTPAETAHRAATPGHLGQIAMLLGRKIRFNPQTEEIIGDETASRMLSRPYRAPWSL
ncbi:MAG: Gfo/Idh/MocA family oxidoreductase [candidate division KSB1 bacterium]|nr:Gfo/Idh/MocA family oxidoreductase [candidate division KSB1 bacterium]